MNEKNIQVVKEMQNYEEMSVEHQGVLLRLVLFVTAIFVESVWIVFGFFIWVPYVVRMMLLVSSISFMRATKPTVDVRSSIEALNHAVLFYWLGIMRIWQGILNRHTVEVGDNKDGENAFWVGLKIVVVQTLWAAIFWLVFLHFIPIIKIDVHWPGMLQSIVQSKVTVTEGPALSAVAPEVTREPSWDENKISNWISEMQSSIYPYDEERRAIHSNQYLRAVSELSELSAWSVIPGQLLVDTIFICSGNVSVRDGYFFAPFPHGFVDENILLCQKTFEILISQKATWACPILLEIQTKGDVLFEEAKSTIKSICDTQEEQATNPLSG